MKVYGIGKSYGSYEDYHTTIDKNLSTSKEKILQKLRDLQEKLNESRRKCDKCMNCELAVGQNGDLSEMREKAEKLRYACYNPEVEDGEISCVNHVLDHVEEHDPVLVEFELCD